MNGANVLRRARLPGDLFARESVRLDSATYFRLWVAIDAEAGTAGGPAPLRFAQKMSADWFVALCSEDMNGALARLAKYKRLSGPMALKVDRDAEPFGIGPRIAGFEDPNSFVRAFQATAQQHRLSERKSRC